jgi:hypothetical protein
MLSVDRQVLKCHRTDHIAGHYKQEIDAGYLARNVTCPFYVHVNTNDLANEHEGADDD